MVDIKPSSLHPAPSPISSVCSRFATCKGLMRACTSGNPHSKRLTVSGAGSRKAKPISDVCNPGFSIDPFMHCIAEPRPSPTSITPRWKTHAPTLHHEPPSPHLLKASLQRPNPRVSISSPHKEPQRSLNLPTEQAHISTTPT